MTYLESFNTYLPSIITLFIFVWGVRYELRQNKIERRHKSRIHFDLEACFYGPQNGFYIAEFVAVLNNGGHTRCLIERIDLTVKGIEANVDIKLFNILTSPEAINALALFPKNLVKTNMLAKRIKKNERAERSVENKPALFFIEPGVVQRISYVARIPEKIRFVLLKSSFNYHKNSKHSAEKVFEVCAK